MSDCRIQYDDDLAGADCAGREDALNRLLLVECGADGKGRQRYLVKQDAAPATGADELVLFAREEDGGLRPCLREAADGATLYLA